MTQLHTIYPDGAVASEDYAGPVEYRAPPFAEMRHRLRCDTVEHVSVLWKGRPCHMFVDEDGRAKELPRNERATRVYYNATLRRRGETAYLYDDLSSPANRLPRGFEDPGFYIVGAALLWEGDLE